LTPVVDESDSSFAESLLLVLKEKSGLRAIRSEACQIRPTAVGVVTTTPF
jgi:hypothetical protein